MTDILGDPHSKPASGSDLQRRMDAVAPYAATVAATVVYSVLALRRVWELQAGAFDAGLVDSALYKVSIGLGNVSGLTGEALYAGRPLIYALGLPLYWLDGGLGYPGLLVLQAISVALVGLSAWLIADAVGLGRGKKYAALLFVLASPAAYWAIITELHTTGLSMGLLAMTVAGSYRRWRLTYFWVLPLLASMARIEVAVAVVIAGLLLLRVSRSHARVTIAVGVVATVALAVVMVAISTPSGTLEIHLGYLGAESLAQLPKAALTHPAAVLDQLLSPMFLVSIMMWLITVGFALPMRASRWFLVAVPTFLISAIGSPWFADFWFQHYWNHLLVGAAVAFVLSLAQWSFSGRIAVGLVVVVLVVAWIVPGSLLVQSAFPVFYPAASIADQQAASIASSAPGALSTTWNLVLPGAHREWVYLFPNPFVCPAGQPTLNHLAGPAPDVVITKSGWERQVGEMDIGGLRRTLSEDYQITNRIGSYTVRELIPGALPPLVAGCEAVNRGEESVD